MSKESLMRVLGKMKEEARGMRKGNLEARIHPKPKPVAAVEEEMKPLEVPDDLLAEPEKPEDTKGKEKALEAAAIRKMISRA